MALKNKNIKKNIPMPPDHGPTLEHILLNGSRSSEEKKRIAENHMQATSQTNTLLENEVEASSRILVESKKTNEKLDELNKKLEPEEIGDAKEFIVKGKKGDKGDKPTDEELIALIKPLIPAPVKGDKGDKPTAREILALIRPLIPDVEDGHTPTRKELLELIKPLIEAIKIPIPKDGKRGARGPAGEDGKTPKISIKGLIQKLKGKISYDDLKDTPNLETFRNRGKGGAGYLGEISDVALPRTETPDGYVLSYSRTTKKWTPVAPTGGGSGGFTYIGEIVAGSGTTFTLAHVPVDSSRVVVFGGGSRLTPGSDFTISGAVITPAFAYSAGQVVADYS